jgi:hypothetical protein
MELSLSIEYEVKQSDNRSTENKEKGDARQNRIEKNVSVEVQYLPIGPFQMTVLQSARPAWMSASVFGPMSSPIHPASMLLMSTTCCAVRGMRVRGGMRVRVKLEASRKKKECTQ